MGRDLRQDQPGPQDGLDRSLDRAFAALADPTRRDIVARLSATGTDGISVANLAASYAVSLQAVSKHLKVLEGAGLVHRSRSAQRRPVHLDADVLDLMTAWIERYRRAAQERYTRLDALLADAHPAGAHDRPSPSDESAHHQRNKRKPRKQR